MRRCLKPNSKLFFSSRSGYLGYAGVKAIFIDPLEILVVVTGVGVALIKQLVPYFLCLAPAEAVSHHTDEVGSAFINLKYNFFC